MTENQPKQLVLGMQLRDEARFDNFHVNAANAPLLRNLNHLSSDDHLIYLWGARSSGRSHLIQALCHQQAERGDAALYLPLEDHASLSADMLQGVSSLSLVCLDDVDAICGIGEWEQALFQLYNELSDTDTHLLVTANCPPQQLAFDLPDLKSRLQSGTTYQLASPDDLEKREILRLRAANRGMELTEQVADFIVQRAERSLHALLALLDVLDRETLERRRRLTIPLIKEVLGW